MSTGDVPEMLSQAILVGIILVGRLGVHVHDIVLVCARIQMQLRTSYACACIYAYVRMYVPTLYMRERENACSCIK